MRAIPFEIAIGRNLLKRTSAVRSLEGSHTSEALKRLHQALSSGAYRRDRTMDAA